MREKIKKVTPGRLAAMKSDGVKITMMTAYDYPTALLLDRAGIDLLLVGDSLGTVIQGRETTLPVTLDQMIYHTEMVARAVGRAMVIADMPFPYAQIGPEEAVRAAARVLKETRAAAVKVEGGKSRAEVVRALVGAGIPVMGHCGLMPQSIRRLGGYKIERNRAALMEDVLAVQESGAFAVVLECVPRGAAEEISKRLAIPTIGIGAGPHCDGQVLVFHDLMGYGEPEKSAPKHSTRYAELGEAILNAASRYAEDVRSGAFPTAENSFDD